MFKKGDKLRYNGGYVECGQDLTIGKIYELEAFTKKDTLWYEDIVVGELFITDDNSDMLSLYEDEFNSFNLVEDIK